MVAFLVIAFFSPLPAHAELQDAAAESKLRTESQISPRMLSRLLLIAATSAGRRMVAVGEHGYAIYSDDQGKTWLRGTTPRRAMLTAARRAIRTLPSVPVIPTIRMHLCSR